MTHGKRTGREQLCGRISYHTVPTELDKDPGFIDIPEGSSAARKVYESWIREIPSLNKGSS